MTLLPKGTKVQYINGGVSIEGTIHTTSPFETILKLAPGQLERVPSGWSQFVSRFNNNYFLFCRTDFIHVLRPDDGLDNWL